MAAVGDAYRLDPPRSQVLTVRSLTPFNGETPGSLLADEFLTPTSLHFVRNHLPVPIIDAAEWRLSVTPLPGFQTKSYR